MSDLKLSLEEVRGLMDAFAASGLTRLKLKDGDFELSLGKERETVAAVPQPFQPVPAVERAAVSTPAAGFSETEGNIVKSPIVGTFYASPSPEKPAYVALGKKVGKGDVLFIIESMKLMNEVTSEYDGIVEKILVENGQPVEYGQPVMVIR